jgi:phage-related protein
MFVIDYLSHSFMNLSGKTEFLMKQPQLSSGKLYQPYHNKYDESPKEVELNFSKDENIGVVIVCL